MSLTQIHEITWSLAKHRSRGDFAFIRNPIHKQMHMDTTASAQPNPSSGATKATFPVPPAATSIQVLMRWVPVERLISHCHGLVPHHAAKVVLSPTATGNDGSCGFLL